VKKNINCERQSKKPLEYIIKHPIVRQQGETMVEKINEEIDLSMRDLYNRKGQLENAIGRVNLLPDPDKQDILKLLQFMNDNRNADLTIVKNISILTTFRAKLKKPFRDATDLDMREAFSEIAKEGWKTKKGTVKEYSPAADKKFRIVIKKFYKIAFGNNEFYPSTIKWIRTKSTKDKSTKKLDMRKYLTYEQIIKLIEITDGLQRKTFLAISYELGGRPEEILRLTNVDLINELDGINCTLRGKTGERVIKVVEFEGLLKNWLANHPLRHQRIFPLWISEATNNKNNPLGIAGAEKIAEEMIPKVDPNKEAKLYTLRHSRATFLAKCGWNQWQMCAYFGWDYNSEEPATYIHLSGSDLNQAILFLHGNEQAQKQRVVVLDKCVRCRNKLSTSAPFCNECGLSTSMSDVYLKGLNRNAEINNTEIHKEAEELQQQISEMKSKIDKLQQQQEKSESTVNLLEKLVDWNYVERIRKRNGEMYIV
jgi:integrase